MASEIIEDRAGVEVATAGRWSPTGTLWIAGLVLGLAMATIAAPGFAGEIPHIEIVAFGTYTPSMDYGRLPAKYRQDSIVEVQLTGMPRLIERTDRIEARPCVRFGLQYRATNFAPDESAVAQMRVDHPTLARPDGRRSDTDTYDIPVSGEVGWTGFDFKEVWEMVPGTWTFSVLDNGRALATQRFTIVPPSDGTAPHACVPAITSLPSWHLVAQRSP
jgi:hypothetical protein